MLEKVTLDDIEWLLSQGAQFNVSRRLSHRLQYVTMNASAEARYVFDKKTGKPLEKNPFADARVRHAIAKAIDKARLVREVLKLDDPQADEFVLPSLSTLAPGSMIDNYDPKAARRLLAQAGYPDGFKMTLHGPNDRYIRDGQILEAIAGMLSEAGIETTAESMPKKEFFPRRTRYEFGAWFQGLSTTGNALQLLGLMFHTKVPEKHLGAFNYTGFSNPEIDALLSAADSVIEPAQRRTYQRQVTLLALEQATVVPLYFEPSIWVTRQDLEYIPRESSFERTLAANIRLPEPQTDECL